MVEQRIYEMLALERCQNRRRGGERELVTLAGRAEEGIIATGCLVSFL